MTVPKKIAIVVAHPIQYLVHRYRVLQHYPGVRVKVLFGSRHGLGSFFDKEFVKTISWGVDLLEGYDCVFAGEGVEETATVPAAVFQTLSEFKPDMIWIHGYSDRCTRAAWKWGWKNRTPVYLSGDTNIRKEDRKTMAQKIKRHLFFPLLFSSLAGVLTVGEANEAFYARYGVARNKMIRLPFTVDDRYFHPVLENKQDSRDAFRRSHHIPLDAMVACWCGKLATWKDPFLFAEAMGKCRLNAAPSPLYGLVIGDGPLCEALKKKIEAERLPIVMTGFLNVEEVPHAYAASDFLVHTCWKESYGLVAVEAAYMELPLIVPESMGAVGLSDAARPGLNAFVYPDGDVRRLAEHIGTLAGEGSTLSRMRLESRKVYQSLDEQFASGVDRLISADRRKS